MEANSLQTVRSQVKLAWRLLRDVEEVVPAVEHGARPLQQVAAERREPALHVGHVLRAGHRSVRGAWAHLRVLEGGLAAGQQQNSISTLCNKM